MNLPVCCFSNFAINILVLASMRKNSTNEAVRA
jgi:hypothetical protein